MARTAAAENVFAKIMFAMVVIEFPINQVNMEDNFYQNENGRWRFEGIDQFEELLQRK